MIDKIRDADRRARRGFTYVADKVDTWRSHAAAVKANQPWRGDCDDLASTVTHLCIEAGVSMKDLWFAMVSSTKNGKVDHLIALVRVDGKAYVIGDTFGLVYPMATMPHQLLFIHRMDWPLKKWVKASGAKDLV